MHHRLLQTIEDLRTYAVVFDEGDDPYELLTRFARDEQLTGSSLTGIGALSQVTIGWFNPDTREYERSTLDEQCEVVSLLGDIAVATVSRRSTPTSCSPDEISRRSAATCSAVGCGRPSRSSSPSPVRRCANGSTRMSASR